MHAQPFGSGALLRVVSRAIGMDTPRVKQSIVLRKFSFTLGIEDCVSLTAIAFND